MGPGSTHTTPLAIAFALAMLGCSEPAFDGLYQVESYSFNETSCARPGAEIEHEFPKFRIEERSWFGLTIYPVYPCDDDGECAENNHGEWNLVTVEEDLDQVSMTSAVAAGDACVLSSVDLVIDGVDDDVVLERRVSQLVIEPYDASTCTTDRAKAARRDMECVQLLRLVGELVASGRTAE